MIPFNRYILIEPIEEESEKSQTTVLVPDEYRQKSKHIKAKILGKAFDCKIDVSSDDIVVVDGPMVEELKVGGKTYNLVLENYVFGRIVE